VSGGSQSFNAVNQMRVLGRWMRMLTIPNQSSIPKAFQEFDEAGRMRPSPLYDRIVDVMEELFLTNTFVPIMLATAALPALARGGTLVNISGVIAEQNLPGMAAYLRYGVKVRDMMVAAGGKPGYAGPVTGLMLGEVEELWDMVALAEYPSLAAFRAMVNDPEYAKLARHRDAGLAGQLNIKTRGTLG